MFSFQIEVRRDVRDSRHWSGAASKSSHQTSILFSSRVLVTITNT